MAELTIKISEGEVKAMRFTVIVVTVIVGVLFAVKLLRGAPPPSDETYKKFLSDCTQELRAYECIALWRQGRE